MTRLLVNGRFLTQPITGVQRYAREMLAALESSDLTIGVVAPRGAGPLPGKTERLDDGSILKGHAWEQMRLSGWMRKWNADLLWSPCNTGPLSVDAQVVTIHDASVFAGPEWFSASFRAFYKWLLPRLGRKVRVVVTDSEFSKSELVKYGVADAAKIRVVPAGVGPQFAPGGAKGGYVLFVGTRNPRKNLARLIEAWSRVPDKGGRVLRAVGGAGRAFSREALPPIPADVKLEDAANDDALVALYRGADLLVQPSLYEGFGLPPLEAMACGTPAVVSRVASHPEVCGDAAIYCDPLDVADIARAIAKGLTHPPTNCFEQAARFTWPRAAATLTAVFERSQA